MSTSILMLLTLCIGLGLGMGVYHVFFRLSPQERILQTQLQEAEQKLIDYQMEVSNHLNRTAELINVTASHFDQLHDHVLQASVALNLDGEKPEFLDSESEDERHKDR